MLAWGAAAGDADADAAEHVRESGSFSRVLTRACADPVRADIVFDSVTHTFFDRDGNPTRLSFTGSVRFTYTNLTTGTTYEPNTSGPGFLDLQTGATRLAGGGIFVTPEMGLVAGDGLVVLDENGEVLSVRGHLTSVCEAVGSPICHPGLRHLLDPTIPLGRDRTS